MNRKIHPAVAVVVILAVLGVVCLAFTRLYTGKIEPLIDHFPTASDPVWYRNGKPVPNPPKPAKPADAEPTNGKAAPAVPGNASKQ